MISISVKAEQFTDFSGVWVGACHFNDKSSPDKKEVIMKKSSGITINGKQFHIGKPTIDEQEDIYDGFKYKQITVYDFKWDDQNKVILTAANWLGWYYDKNDTWTGGGVGSIRRTGHKLEMIRNYSDSSGKSVKERCIYEKE